MGSEAFFGAVTIPTKMTLLSIYVWLCGKYFYLLGLIWWDKPRAISMLGFDAKNVIVFMGSALEMCSLLEPDLKNMRKAKDVPFFRDTFLFPSIIEMWVYQQNLQRLPGNGVKKSSPQREKSEVIYKCSVSFQEKGFHISIISAIKYLIGSPSTMEYWIIWESLRA